MARKILICKIIVLFTFFFSQSTFSKTIDEVINLNPSFEPAIIAISVKDANSGKVIYQKNEKKLLHPASTLKMITAPAVLDYLGKNYKFKTAIYKSGTNTYLKLGADPLFGYDDLYNLISQYASKNFNPIKKLILDDSITDKTSYGVGWQWDDNTSIYFPQISPYIINRNIFAIKAICDGRNVRIEYAQEYKEKVINNLKCSDTTKISIERNVFSKNMAIKLSGTVQSSKIINIPALEPESLFKNSLAYIFLDNNIAFNTNFAYEKTPKFIPQEASIEHSIEDVLKRILTFSDNFAAEVLLKHAGAAKLENTGTTIAGLEVVKDFYRRNGIDVSQIIMVDGSGASMNDYISADFMTNALITIKKNEYFNLIKNSMTTPTIGTFSNRTPELNNKIFVKTGTLANTSAVAGYLKTNSNREIVFAIMLDNLPKKTNPKLFEDEIIRALANL